MTQTMNTGEIRRDLGEITEDLHRILHRRPAADTAVIRLPEPVGYAGPQSPPPPLPRPPAKHDMAAAQPVAPMERVIEWDAMGVRPVAPTLGEYQLRRSVPYVMPQSRGRWVVARHRRPTVWSRLLRWIGGQR